MVNPKVWHNAWIRTRGTPTLSQVPFKHTRISPIAEEAGLIDPIGEVESVSKIDDELLQRTFYTVILFDEL